MYSKKVDVGGWRN